MNSDWSVTYVTLVEIFALRVRGSSVAARAIRMTYDAGPPKAGSEEFVRSLHFLKTMNNYEHAAARHWRDAEQLFATRRLDNADQLFGLAAECALKVALSRSGTTIDRDSGLREHIDVLWERARVHVKGRSNASLASLLKSSNPFHEWAIAQRYFATGHVQQATIDRHRRSTVRLLGAAGVVVQKGSL